MLKEIDNINQNYLHKIRVFKLFNDFMTRQFIVFVFSGGIAALANFFSRIIFNEFTSFENSVVLAFFVGISTGYLLSRFFVFKEFNGSHYQSLFWFVIVNLIALIQTYIISVGLFHYVFPWLGYEFYPAATAHAIGVVFPVFTSFIGHKYLSFRSNTHENS